MPRASSVRALRSEYTVPLRLLGVGLPLTIVAGWAGRGRGPARRQPRRGAGARRHARVHRRRAGPGRGHRPARALAHPAGPERRERTQRRAVRAAVLHRRRPRRGRGGRHLVHHAVTLVSPRSGTGSSAASSRACSAAWRSVWPRATADEPYWGQILPVATAALAAASPPGSAAASSSPHSRPASCSASTPGHKAEVTELVDETGGLLNERDVHRLRRGDPRPHARERPDLRWSSTALLSLTVVRMLPVGVAMLGTGARARRSGSWAGSGRVGSPRSSSA